MEPDQVALEILSLLGDNYFDPRVLQRWIDAGGGEEILRSVAAGGGRSGGVNAALGRLGTSHTRRFTPDEIEYYHMTDAYASAGLGQQLKSIFPRGIRYAGIGVLVARRERGFFVANVLPGGPADRAGIVRGDELVASEESPYAPVLPFRGLENRTVGLRVRREAARPCHTVRVRVVSLRPSLALRKGSVEGARIMLGARGRIGYYRPLSLAGDRQWRTLVDTVSGPLRDCDALILDLRLAIGGASPDHAEFFVGRSPELWLDAVGRGRLIINPRWRKPLVVLADETTRSGNEVLAFTLQRAGAPIVGQQTAGDVTAARPFLLRDSSLLLVATYRIKVDGVVLEGSGVTPDVIVEAPIEYAGGADPQLDAALALADRWAG